ncbi:bidirectional sugar transporter SWEET2a-like isoform X1 [Zingiber officinale]|uniref:bidirectional sugar transporter SWEET2a-like isoform X1 n=1 Tax=Zingiber officinale TaxID=94328 RepID=UPI001C4C3D42|nr:bidirectional sugar transporter SWEET2a-like isoform X1 [Zingiber officinale]
MDQYSPATVAAGIAGNVFAFVLFLSPVPTFGRIVRNRSTQEFSGSPYVYSLMNCLICMWYGMPWVAGVVLVATVNSAGAAFQMAYVALFLFYADRTRKIRMAAMLIAVLCAFAAIVYLSLEFLDKPTRKALVGYLSVASLISMFASPLFIINLVIRTRSVEFMPFYLSLATFLMSLSFFAYGGLLHDYFIYIPNGIGTLLGAVQLLVYGYYSRKSEEDSTLPLLP